MVGGVKCHFWIHLHDDCTVLKQKSRLFRFGYARAYRRRYVERNRSRRPTCRLPITSNLDIFFFCMKILVSQSLTQLTYQFGSRSRGLT
ncbi:Uncharacterized protein APZ42_001451 [Daphnia magna]|uniref:Uncharacterized protein n=1 Tax=Daphnia magna TaxID=35525 RepID=A0A164IZ89_9CRUS|nr:Uncharacterized protein APZ42_001451 [Daphnia magna]